MKTILSLAILFASPALIFAQMPNGPSGAGGSGGSGKSSKPEEKINPRAISEGVVVRWYNPDLKAADVEAALKNKDFVKGVTMRAEEQIVVVSYFGEPPGIDRVRQLVGGGNSVTLSPCKMSLSFPLSKDAKGPDTKKLHEKVRAMKGISREESFEGSRGTWWVDAQIFNPRTVAQVVAPLGYEVTSSTHELWTIGWEYKTPDQPGQPLWKAVMAQKGVMLSVEFDPSAKRMVILSPKGALGDATLKTAIEKAGFKPGDLKH